MDTTLFIQRKLSRWNRKPPDEIFCLGKIRTFTRNDNDLDGQLVYFHFLQYLVTQSYIPTFTFQEQRI